MLSGQDANTTTSQSEIIIMPCYLKGIVQRDVRGVESRLKRSALMNYLVALVYFFKLKGHSCERSKKPVSPS
jgi:hypothetical protein